jgi:hypothetical protein
MNEIGTKTRISPVVPVACFGYLGFGLRLDY